MVITLTKGSDGSVSGSIDTPATTLSAAPADVIAQQVAAIIAQALE